MHVFNGLVRPSRRIHPLQYIKAGQGVYIHGHLPERGGSLRPPAKAAALAAGKNVRRSVGVNFAAPGGTSAGVHIPIPRWKRIALRTAIWLRDSMLAQVGKRSLTASLRCLSSILYPQGGDHEGYKPLTFGVITTDCAPAASHFQGQSWNHVASINTVRTWR